MELLKTPEFNRLERSVDTAVLRNQVIANNVANVDTPYFKRSEVVFEELLQQELAANKSPSFTTYRTDEKHIAIQPKHGKEVQPQIMVDATSAMNNNQNNVDIDYEMSLLAKNQLNYNMMVQQISYDIQHLRTAIGGTG